MIMVLILTLMQTLMDIGNYISIQQLNNYMKKIV